MKFQQYLFFDKDLKKFDVPIYLIEGTEDTYFNYVMNDMRLDNKFYMNCDNYSIYKGGIFDDDTGLFEDCGQGPHYFADCCKYISNKNRKIVRLISIINNTRCNLSNEKIVDIGPDEYKEILKNSIREYFDTLDNIDKDISYTVKNRAKEKGVI